jgi:nucleoside-diphosphate kinase
MLKEESKLKVDNILEETLIIIKPDAVKKKIIGKILDKFESNGFRIKALRMIHLDEQKAKEFYSIHKEKPFFEDLIKFITSGPVVVAIIEGDDSIKRVRELIGDTNPAKAREGTIRREFGTNVTMNAIHASDSYESFIREAKVIFSDNYC